ncbi:MULTISPECIES: glycosyl hydrolase family 8 [Sphingobium]|uniref:Glucanase n=1 Tax=Sphingobium tyrosinilyticum TaxID=2715436 RepID=A0ABV9F0P2_9SPHN|nr:glycosyl hydrolase family 8 [Sphingobium sp. EP60837]ANI79296.1 Cellulase [Sphingobium sp. EP60837]
MGFERRTVLTALAFALTTGCARAKSPARSIPDTARWLDYKRRFLLPEGRIVDTGNGGVSHSEGQGYGMLLAQAANDATAFDAMARWTRGALMRKDVALHSWRFVPGQANPVADLNNATDGDLLIAWALLLAGHRWGKADYLQQSADISSAITQKLIVSRHGFTLLLPGLEGFAKSDRVVINPSYYVWPAIDALSRQDPRPWKRVSADGVRIMKVARFGTNALPTDWLDIKGEGIVEPAEGRDPVFGFEGIRIPLYCQMSGRRSLCDAIARYWLSLNRSGKPLPAWINVVTGETAPYPLSSGGSTIAARLLGRPEPPARNDGDYYSTTLAMMNRVPI